MAWNDDGINTYVRDLISPMLHSSYATTKPLLRLMAGPDASGLDKLGDPDFGVIIGGKNLGRAEKQMLNGSKVHKFRYQKAQTDTAENVLPGAATPAATGFAEDNVGTAGNKWVHFWNPIKIREDSVNDARNGGSPEATNLQIAAIVEEAVGQGFQRALEKQQAQLWAGTLTSAQQARDHGWEDYLGLVHQVSDGTSTGETDYTHIGNVDRTAETELKAKVNLAADLVTAGIMTATDNVTLDVLRWLKINNTYGGVTNKYAGAGNLAITTPAQWLKLADDADSNQVFSVGKLGDVGMDGFKYPVIQADNTLVTYDPDCTSGCLYLLCTDHWVFEVQSGSNFQVEPWQEKWRNEEGGEYYRWTQIHAKTRLTCTRPDLQVKITGLE